MPEYLTAWGTISPTKDISPARLTAHPARSAVKIRNMILKKYREDNPIMVEEENEDS